MPSLGRHLFRVGIPIVVPVAFYAQDWGARLAGVVAALGIGLVTWAAPAAIDRMMHSRRGFAVVIVLGTGGLSAIVLPGGASNGSLAGTLCFVLFVTYIWLITGFLPRLPGTEP